MMLSSMSSTAGPRTSGALQAAFFVVFALGGQLQVQLLFRFLLGSLNGVMVDLVGPIVAVCGPVAWVGLLAPHLARRLRPSDDALGWLPTSALCGALVVLVADLLARLALAPIESPLGAWTALAGVIGGLALARRRGFVR